MELVKLHVSIDIQIQERLAKEAEARRITVQELVRAVILPEWIAHAKPVEAIQQ